VNCGSVTVTGEVSVNMTVPICSVPGSPLESLSPDQPKVRVVTIYYVKNLTDQSVNQTDLYIE